MKIDRFDEQILERLQLQADISNLELAELVGLSPTPCARRVKLLEQAGVIKQRVTLLDKTALDLELTIFAQVNLDNQAPEIMASFETAVASWPEVLCCDLLAGQLNGYFLKIVLTNLRAYEQFLVQKLTQVEGVNGVQSSFVLRNVIESTKLPIPEWDESLT